MAEQSPYFVFAVILRARVGRDGVFAGQEWYRERVAILETKGAETAEAVAHLLNSSLGEGPGEDYPEGFIAVPSAELTLAENTQARRDLQSSDDSLVALRSDAQAVLAEVERTRLDLDGKTDQRRIPESGDIDVESASGSVVLRGLGHPPMVGGSEKDRLSDAGYELIKALINAGERGLSKYMIEAKASSARRLLKGLRKDPEWQKVIQMAGKTGRGYRII